MGALFDKTARIIMYSRDEIKALTDKTLNQEREDHADGERRDLQRDRGGLLDTYVGDRLQPVARPA
jgi:hypothetical protein